VYRIVQECVSNAVRHGAPSRIEVWIKRVRNGAGDADKVALEVSDDGRGMREKSGIGLGLTGIAERVEATGGSLTLTNRPGGGFVVNAVLPCPPRTQAPATSREVE
jgi:signal transduction histidine kinase